jgi:hypothetical protein
VSIDMDSSCGMFAPSVWFPACSFGIHGYLQIGLLERIGPPQTLGIR